LLIIIIVLSKSRILTIRQTIYTDSMCSNKILQDIIEHDVRGLPSTISFLRVPSTKNAHSQSLFGKSLCTIRKPIYGERRTGADS
jgi:hypothetical protein